MRSSRPRLTARLLLLTCLVCPLTESLDVWHATLDGGNDTEFALVVAALSVGVGFLAVRLLLKSECVASILSGLLSAGREQFSAFDSGFPALRIAGTGPPPIPLRI